MELKRKKNGAMLALQPFLVLACSSQFLLVLVACCGFLNGAVADFDLAGCLWKETYMRVGNVSFNQWPF